ncbi:hypothetical protein D3C72_1813230 [compost metagenome]
MGIGEAFVTLLNEKGIPTPLVQTYLCSPHSRMDILSEQEIDQLVAQSKLAPKYNQELDSESAYELLQAKIEANVTEEEVKKPEAAAKNGRPAKEAPSVLDKILNSAAGKQAQRSITRGLLDVVFKMFK